MSQTQSLENIVSSMIDSLTIPEHDSEKLKSSLIKSINRQKLIYPGTYKRRFNIDISDFSKIMDKLIEYEYVNLRFKIVIDDYIVDELFKFGNLPTSIYNDDKDTEMCVDIVRHVLPVYEVCK